MLKKLFKGVKKVAKKVAPFAGLVAGAFGMNPMAAAGLGALIGGIGGGSKGAVMGGLGGYFGGKAFGAGNPLFKFQQGSILPQFQSGAFANMPTMIGKGGNIFDTAIKEKGLMDYLPLITAGTGLAYAGGLFDEPPIPEDAIPKEYKYDPNLDPLKNINEKYKSLYDQYSPLPSSSIYGYLQSIGAMKNGGLVPAYADGGVMAFRDGEEVPPMQMLRVPPENLPMSRDMINEPGIMSLEELEQFMEELTILKNSGDLTEEQYKQAVQMLMSQAGKATAMDGGVFAAGGDTEGRTMGPGTGRLDNLPGYIYDQNTGQKSNIVVSPNEHIIPEYTLYAMGGGDTEKGHDMLNKLRKDTKPMAKQMGYDFEGAENGTVRYG